MTGGGNDRDQSLARVESAPACLDTSRAGEESVRRMGQLLIGTPSWSDHGPFYPPGTASADRRLGGESCQQVRQGSRRHHVRDGQTAHYQSSAALRWHGIGDRLLEGSSSCRDDKGKTPTGWALARLPHWRPSPPICCRLGRQATGSVRTVADRCLFVNPRRGNHRGPDANWLEAMAPAATSATSTRRTMMRPARASRALTGERRAGHPRARQLRSKRRR